MRCSRLSPSHAAIRWGVVTDDLLEACRLTPDDDVPRLVWADAVGGERGEFVVIQCDLARGGLAPAEAAARRRRERELLKAYGREWSGFGAYPPRLEFRRGFVEAIQLDVRKFVEYGEEIFQRAPLLRSLNAIGLSDPLDKLRRLFGSPAFSRLHGLDLWGLGSERQSDEAVRVLVESGTLARLGALGISESRLSDASMHYLAASGELEHLERLWLRNLRLLPNRLLDNGAFVNDGRLAVLARALHVKSLAGFGLAYADQLPAVTELESEEVTDDTLTALGRSRVAATIEELRVSGILNGFLSFPRLRTLDFVGLGPSLGGVLLGRPQGQRGVAALPSLRRLRLEYQDPETTVRVARTWGPQLEELVVCGKPDPSVIEQLQKYVAGDVLWTMGRGASTML